VKTNSNSREETMFMAYHCQKGTVFVMKTMKIVIINGSPRKNATTKNPANTWSFLQSILEGASLAGVEVEVIFVNLYDFNRRSGCISCFKCKQGQHLQTCPIKDEFTAVLKEINDCDVIVFGTPIWLGDITSGMRAFLEKLLYPHISYEKPYASKPIRTLFVYSMNRSLASARESGYPVTFQKNKNFLSRVYSESDYIVIPESAQWDYSKYPCTRFPADERKEWLKNVFPALCELFKVVGKNLATGRKHLTKTSLDEMQSIMHDSMSNVGDSITNKIYQKPICHINTGGGFANDTPFFTYSEEKTLLLSFDPKVGVDCCFHEQRYNRIHHDDELVYRNAKIDVAKNMFAKGFPLDQIMVATGLTDKELEKIQ
jgi:multimeric flavodoxin WrbA